MVQSGDPQTLLNRTALSALGAGAALALWGLAENWRHPAIGPELYLALFSFTSAYTVVALALAGPVSVLRAMFGALVLAVPVMVLVLVAGLRHSLATDVLDDPVTLAVLSVLILCSTPFLSVCLQDRTAWLRYPALFDTSWTIAVRYGVALIFVGIFWLVLFLSGALLDLVDVPVIERLMRTDWARFGLTGGMFGLGLAVVYELRNAISPNLVLRLLRLLVPVVLVVLAVFLVAVPFRGLTHLFGEFSAAGTLMGAAIAAITLISSALDGDDDHGAATRIIRLSTQALAGLLPFLTGLAVWAVALRVRQYGWTPDRVLAACASTFLLVYGAGYCLSVLRRTDWAGRIRKINVAMAFLIIVVCAAWMTPLLNAYQITTTSQIARYEAGRTTLDDLALWSLGHDWGRAGQAGLVHLEGLTSRPDYADLMGRIDLVRTRPNAYQYRNAVSKRATPDRAAMLVDLMPVRPQNPPLTAEMFAGLSRYQLDQFLASCRRLLADGRPGCVMLRGSFRPLAEPAVQGMVLLRDGTGQTRVKFLTSHTSTGGTVRDVYDPVSGRLPTLRPDAIAQALDGDFEIRPSGLKALFIGDKVLVPRR